MYLESETQKFKCMTCQKDTYTIILDSKGKTGVCYECHGKVAEYDFAIYCEICDDYIGRCKSKYNPDKPITEIRAICTLCVDDRNGKPINKNKA